MAKSFKTQVADLVRTRAEQLRERLVAWLIDPTGEELSALRAELAGLEAVVRYAAKVDGADQPTFAGVSADELRRVRDRLATDRGATKRTQWRDEGVSSWVADVVAEEAAPGEVESSGEQEPQ